MANVLEIKFCGHCKYYNPMDEESGECLNLNSDYYDIVMDYYDELCDIWEKKNE